MPETVGFVVVANRLPVDLVTDDDGGQHWQASPGGLVSALAPALAGQRAAWVGWPGVPDAAPEPFADDTVGEDVTLHAVPLDADEIAAHYEGAANATLWPLYHDLVVAPVYDRDRWETHRAVNRRFAEAAAEVAAPGATVWVQDYQLQLVPRMLRELRPDLCIGFFLHIPFPPVELFLQLPWRREVVEGLLGADLVGFHTPGGAANFRWLAQRLCAAEVDDAPIGLRRADGEIRLDGRTTRVGAFPISIDSAAFARRGADPATAERARALRAELGDPATVLLGVDRLDYTKGIEVRLDAYGELLDGGRLDPATTVLVQVATPSRERVDAYRRTRERVERTVGRINGDHAGIGRPAIHYVHRSLPPDELAALYLAADVALVTPLRDGMNLVAKEFVATRTDDSGDLVLSEFTGAAEELTAARLVNPHDLDGVAAAIADAVAGLGSEDSRRRVAELAAQVAEHDVARWSEAFLTALGRPPA
ncbi:alpha,alpha-trehalose-phosphate synthase (UDP-forming) [Actinomycetospora soli]|uniref:alpha,alpha-trehalose-phosphate synthase (UDP-forming) n=1 Tax=Actinomycetospora soli TaxID=2893887 RepID=UPI001E36A65C|nr:trehalose-6-phosphate synthase [Actinomycetospora soli]MCD2186936.1 trehalose-6-phosphate synthase [Actinomycetospora soli]